MSHLLKTTCVKISGSTFVSVCVCVVKSNDVSFTDIFEKWKFVGFYFTNVHKSLGTSLICLARSEIIVCVYVFFFFFSFSTKSQIEFETLNLIKWTCSECRLYENIECAHSHMHHALAHNYISY